MSPRSARLSGAKDAAPVFSALGDATRLALVDRLCAGLVRDSRRGRERLWQLEAPRLDEASRYLETISRRWDDALDRLRKFVED